MASRLPSLTLRSVFSRSLADVALGAGGEVLAGLTPAARALTVAGLTRTRAGLVLVVVPTDADVEQLTDDTRFFFSGLEGSSQAATDQAVLPFPSIQIDPYRGMTPHFRVAAARARALHGAASGLTQVIVASAAALLPRVSPPERLLRASLQVVPGVEIEPQRLAELLIEGGFSREDPVDEHGSFTIRGGIIDVFPPADREPVRIEFVGDTVETLRHFDPTTQRSTTATDHVRILPARERFDDADPTSVVSFLASSPGGLQVVISEQEQVVEHVNRTRAQFDKSFREASARGHVALPPPAHLFATWAEAEPWVRVASRLEELVLEDEPRARRVSCQAAREFRGRMGEWVDEVRQARDRGDTVLFVAESEGRAERIVEILADYDVLAIPVEGADDTHGARVLVAVGTLSKGFRLAGAGVQLYAETDVFEEERRTTERRKHLAKAFLSDLRDLKVGDLVVHVDHGIGEFAGLRQLSADGMSSREAQEFLELRYHGDDKLFVPVERLDLVQRYMGGSRPALDRLGGVSWEKAKTRVKRAMRAMADELLRLYAQRRAIAGHPFSPDTHWQQEFEAAFPYELTPDQVTAVADVKRDMEAPAPMDRLLCGDVGYGKTEVAMRAAFKAVMDGKQVAFLAPTTVLAFQHLKTLRERFVAFPVTVELVSRFRTRQEIKQVLKDLASGRVDIIVGTHRLLSRDVSFKDLGLLVVDEEQRFGVAHKERIKQWRKQVDVLTMTATPIPRTLNMSLVGIRDMSTIETPPKDRLSIQTNVVKFDAPVIERAIRNELARAGQVYFVHNRVDSIFSVGHLLQRLVPEARIVVAHGQMEEDQLERAMLGFVERRYDVLLATTIVENGLDIPNANTMIVNRADRYGLAQLYQLRGRVGRSDRPAYAYLLVPPQEALSPVARKRLAAIREFSDLGSGFRVAALDLEIRGAGNLLGGEQSGHIEAVGFEMYMKLLEETIKELRGEQIESEARATVNLGVDLKIEGDYIEDMNQRLTIYRKVASARSEQDVESVLDELRDRYGPFPASVLNLAAHGKIRVKADRLDIDTIDREGRLVVFRFRPNARVDGTRLVGVVTSWPGARLVPPVALTLDLEASRERESPEARRQEGPRRKGRRMRREPEESWWTRRARAGEVAAGFTRRDMLRVPEQDPRAEGGVFDQVAALLDALAAPRLHDADRVM
jgi:transcription-repair coupling factor (superfamily II helicase)